MQTDEVYARCRGEIGCLLEALERNDLSRMAQHVETLRDWLEDLELGAETSSLRLEQLEAIEGLTDAIGRSLEAMHASAAVEMARIHTIKPLLLHFADRKQLVM